MNIQEFVFWGIFLLIASVLIIGQLLTTNTQKITPVPPQLMEYFPDVSKTDKEALLIYENTVYTEKLKEMSDKKPIYGLGEYTGPSFNEVTIKDGAFQIAFQAIIKELNKKKDEIKKSLLTDSVSSSQDYDDYINYVDRIFLVIYQNLSTDNSLTITYRIWKKEKGPIVTYYILSVFQDDYALALVKSTLPEIFVEFSKKSVNFEQIWQNVFNKSQKK